MLKIIVRFLLILIGIILLVSLVFAGLYIYMDKTNGKIESSGIQRRYLLYVPETYDPAKATPLVISIHGFAEWPAHQMQLSHWNQLADEYGFIVVYPSGTKFPKRWIASGLGLEQKDYLQDVQFINDLIDHLEDEYHIDPRRIYANGLSNGGGMSFLLSCELANRIAAIGSVSGAYVLTWEECMPSRPVPMIAFHGTADQVVPYLGGSSHSFDVPFPAIPDWINIKANHNGCLTQKNILMASPEIEGISYSDCEENADVIFYTIHGGGHSWPGGEPLPEWIVGQTSQAINATNLMWQFFLDHPMPVH